MLACPPAALVLPAELPDSPLQASKVCLVFSSSSKEFDCKNIKMEKIEVDENVKPLMGSFFINKDPLVLVSNYNSYLSLRPPDCTLYSDDGQEFHVHKVRKIPDNFLNITIFRSLGCETIAEK